MAKKKFTLELTEQELLDIVDLFSTAEAMIGCAELLNDGDEEPDEVVAKQIKRFKRMLARNKLKINYAEK
ncbi:hypothetical protein PG299_10115 [Riemerella anatipestifer]|nr:hypothetical protein [Riemerella anatipestifer]